MDNVAYISLSREMVLRRAMDITANNIANVDTTGFKVESLTQATQAGAPAKDFGVNGPAQFVLDTGVARNFSQGELKKTGAPLDVAIAGSGFFQVQTPQGVRYTRDGAFSMDPQGRLVNAQGDAVLDAGGGEIRFDPLQPSPTIAADGTISQGSLTIGKLGVVDFATPSVLSKQGDNLYANTSNAQPTPVDTPKVLQGTLEGSNVKPIQEVATLIQIQRSYEQVAQLISNVNDLSEQTINRLGKVS